MGLDQASFKRFCDRATAVFLGLWPGRCVINGQSVPCAETADDAALEADERGAIVQTVTVLRVPLASLAEAPALRTTVTMEDGRRLRVVRIAPSTHDTAWTLYCEDSGK